MSKIRNKDQWTAKKFERHIFDTVVKDIIKDQEITRVESWHDKATAFNSLPFLTFLLDDFHSMCRATNPDYTTTATHRFEGGHGRCWADQAIAHHKRLHKWLQSQNGGFTSDLVRMRQMLQEEFKRRTDNDKIMCFKRKCSGEFLIWNAEHLDKKPAEEMQLKVFNFRDLSATFHQRRITTSGSDKIEQFAFSEDGTDMDELQLHHQLPGLHVPFQKVRWNDRSEKIKRHLKPDAESIETTFKLSEENDGRAQKRRRKMKQEIQLRNSPTFKSRVNQIIQRHSHRNNET